MGYCVKDHVRNAYSEAPDDELFRRHEELPPFTDWHLDVGLPGSGTIGVDNEGRCIYCDQAGLISLGYESLVAVLGKSLHALLYHDPSSMGRPIGVGWRIEQACLHGMGIHIENGIAWRTDGTYFPAEFLATPIRRDDKIIGLVVAFSQIAGPNVHGPDRAVSTG